MLNSFPNFPFPLQKDLQFGIEQDIDVVFASFIRKARDIEDIKKELGDKGKHIWIISKVCLFVLCQVISIISQGSPHAEIEE